MELKDILILQIWGEHSYIFCNSWNILVFQLCDSLALSFFFAAKCNKLSGGHRVAIFSIFSLFPLLP